MEEGNTLSTRIHNYLEGRMSPEEQQAFEAERASNEELDKEVKTFLLIKAGLAQESINQKRETLKTLIANHEQSSSDDIPTKDIRGGTRRSLWGYLAIAAGILILAAAVWTLLLKPQQTSPQDLFASYYKVPAAPDMMGASGDSLLRLGHAAFNRQAYSEAIGFYDQALASGLEIEKEPYLYLGIAAMEAGNVDKAKEAFTLARSIQPERSDWYLAMVELKEGNVDTARKQLEAISGAEGHFYQAKAKEVLERL